VRFITNLGGKNGGDEEADTNGGGDNDDSPQVANTTVDS
jgi:hypothetical protein